MVAVTMPPLFSGHPTATYALRFGLLTLIYGTAVWISLWLVPATGGASLVWPVAAVGLAGLLFWGINLWPALTLSFFLVVAAGGVDPSAAVGVALGNTLEAVLGAHLLIWLGFHPLMSRLRDALGLILAAFTSTFVSATVIAASTALFITHSFSADLWTSLWIGHSVSLLSFGAFALRWGYRPFFAKSQQELFEGLALFGLVGFVSYLAAWTEFDSLGPVSLVYVLVFLLIWASLRAGPRGTTLALLIMTLISTTALLFGPDASLERAGSLLFGMQVLIGTLSIIFLLFTSITEERKEAVIALGAQVGKLEDALLKISSEDAAKSEFIAILAHELRNPLSPVLSGLEILKAKESGPKEVLHMMGAHLHTLARLLDDLLDITRISQKKFKLEREVTTLQHIIERSLEMAGPYMAERNHTFTKEMPSQDILMDADPVRLTQAVVNLLNNAAKYTPPGGTISLGLVKEGRQAVIRVRDNGQGIAIERLRKVFEPFAGGAQRSKGPGGLHIGLSLVRRMVELHAGTVVVKSGGVGQGSEFTIRLPLPAAPLEKAPEPIAPKKETRGRFSKEAMEHARAAGPVAVLVVDDNEAAAQMLCTLLEHNGHTVSLAHTGLSALDVARQTQPQVALLDIGLPDIDGYEVGKRLRAELGAQVALVALTGYGQPEDRERARQAGFDDHLVKPVSIVDVERILAQLRRA
ncbi:MAG: sensor hybrid histidine kinase [Candidatus Adlerbacteria bacterium]|nr:sensor hybrid histidine kinase [Candidatus Adlerbacteria bacterium]